MTKRLKRKFILVSMAATFVVTLALILSINLVHHFFEERRLSQVMTEIVEETDTRLEHLENDEQKPAWKRGSGKHGRKSAFVQYSNRFFGAILNQNGELLSNIENQELLSAEELSWMVEQVQKTGKTEGYIEECRYLVVKNYRSTENTFLCFLDCSTDLQNQRMLWVVSVSVGFLGLILSFFFIWFMAEKNVRPIRESMEKQKRFITDASHELKTPLSVISTNMELLHMDLGENEWVDSTRRQVKKLRKLVTNLLSLSKMDEMPAKPERKSFCISSAAQECVYPFEEMAMMQEKTLKSEFTDDLWVKGEEASIRQLLTILCDNAVKYAVGGDITVRLYQEGKKIFFETANAWERNTPPNQLERLFDRFYRGDASRSTSEKEGYGLGLSIAAAIAEKNQLHLSVFEDAEKRIVFQIAFPNKIT